MTVITPIRADNAYIGLAKEVVPGTPVAPSWFPRWLDASIEVDLKAEDVWEGDGSRRLSQVVKNRQMVKIKLVCSPRMNELGFLEEAAMGKGSDTITPGAPAGTLNTAVTGGSSTTLSVTGTGFSPLLTPASGTFYLLIVDPTNGNEVVPCTLPVTGTNPYTFTVASSYNGGKVAITHAGGNVLTVAPLTTVTSSLTSAVAKGATTIPLGTNLNLTGAGTQTLILSPGTASEEIVTVTTPAGSGTGPWVFTLANGAVTKNAHLINDLVFSPVTHVLSDQADGDYFTIEVGLGSLNGAAGTTLRVRSCKVETCKVSGKAGGILTYELEFVGIASSVQGTPATISLEQHPLFLYTQGVWTLDGSAGGDALTIESWDIERKNNCDTGIQTEQLTLASIIFGNVTVNLGFSIVYTSANRIFLVYFGGNSGTTDAQAIGAGAFAVTFTQPDTFESVTYTMLTTHYTKIGLPVPKKDGKAFKQAISAASVSNSGANAYVLQTTVTNSQLSNY